MTDSKNTDNQNVITYENRKNFIFNQNRLSMLSYKYLYESVESIKEIDKIERRIIDDSFIEEILNKLNKVVNKCSSDHKNYFNLGFCYQLLGDHEKAIINYDIAIEINPNDHCYLNNRGCSNSALYKFELAKKDFTFALELSKKDTIFYLNLADTLLDNREVKKAIENYTSFINENIDIAESDKVYSSSFIGRGCAYRKLKDKENAYLDWSYALELGEASASYFLARERIKDLTTHDELSKLKTSEKLILEENPDEYLKWKDSDYINKDWIKTIRRKGINISSLVRNEDRRFKVLEKLISNPDYDRYKFCELAISFADSNGMVKKQFVDRLLKLHNQKWNDSINNLTEIELVKFGKETKKINTYNIISVLDIIGY